MVALLAKKCIRCKSVWIKTTKLDEKQVILLNDIKEDPLLNKQIVITFEECSCLECKNTIGNNTMDTLSKVIEKKQRLQNSAFFML
jgi:hypothetical protein